MKVTDEMKAELEEIVGPMPDDFYDALAEVEAMPEAEREAFMGYLAGRMRVDLERRVADWDRAKKRVAE